MNEWDQMAQLVAEITGHRILAGDTDWSVWIILALQKGKAAMQASQEVQAIKENVASLGLSPEDLQRADYERMQSDYESWLGNDSSPHPLYPERR